jgi:electron transport complex protein RnfE
MVELIKGLWKENPILVTILGLCPTLAVTTSAINALTMGLAVVFVLTASSTIVSLIRNLVPKQVRIASYIVIIATFVTMVDLFLRAYFPPLSRALGPYVPLIVVNCIILGRAESFASKNPLGLSFLDALGMSLGFTATLILLGGIREILGMKTFFGMQVLGQRFEPWVVMVLPPGAFITLGFLLGAKNLIDRQIRHSSTPQRSAADLQEVTVAGASEAGTPDADDETGALRA